MPAVRPTIDLLRRTIQNDPTLRDRLFALHEAGEFVAALARLAEETGHSVTEDVLMAALRQGRRDWIERELP